MPVGTFLANVVRAVNHYEPTNHDDPDLPEVLSRAEVMLDDFLAGQGATIDISAEDLKGERLSIFIAQSQGAKEPSIQVIVAPFVVQCTVALAFALASEEGKRLRRCPDPKCGRYFLRTRKMAYCSTSCSRRVYMRGFRAKERELRERERAELRALRAAAKRRKRKR